MSGAGDGTTGAARGTGGAAWRTALKAYGVLIVLLVVIDALNVLSAVRERAAGGHPIPVWEPATWETSSAIAMLAFAPLALLAAAFAPPRPGGWLRFVLVHPPASALFSSLHILGMNLIRFGLYDLFGARYRGRLFDFAYEYRKDIPAYVIIVGLVWLIGELDARRRRAAPPATAAVFDIKDGARLIRTPVAEILALSSAGNYVEVLLADGRRPLMRGTLAAAETALGPHGFVRTHRSWLVNAGRVRELEAVGSGDFTLRLEGGAEAPLSRRFRAALRELSPSSSPGSSRGRMNAEAREGPGRS
jgi:hypothetical protein